ncbi:MAG: A/G-specific adenine glycosylase [Chloroflexota bacterium]|nr:A/G-specific adenine glycosylase [Chloroflexota bacterium]
MTPAGAEIATQDGLSEGERIAALQEGLLAWYAANRRDLPWRRTRDPYHILVSEMMLQQTQVPRVLPRWVAWLERFPTLAALAAAPTADVLREWSGLGYNSRAVRLQAIAREVVARHGGRMPREVETLRALPGIGDYTARAVACFAWEQDVPVLDTNVKRVLHRVLAGPEAPQPLLGDRQLWALAERAVPPGRGYDWNQALMDFGSSICTARKPACVICPLRTICRAAPTIHAVLAAQGRARRKEGASTAPAVPFTSTNRHYRGQALRALGALEKGEGLALDALGPRVKPGYTPTERPWLYGLVAGLARDGLVAVRHEPGVMGQGSRSAVIRETRVVYDTGDNTAAGETGAAPPELDLTSVRVSLPEA